MPLVLSKYYLALHGSAVALGNQAIAFVGSSGNGKSTLNNKLSESGKFISDDFLLIEKMAEKYHLHSTYPGLRLISEENETAKEIHSIPADSYAYEACPLETIYILTRDKSIATGEYLITDLHEELNLDLLLSEVLVLDPDTPDTQLKMIEELTQLANSVTIKRFSFSDLRSLANSKLIEILQPISS